MTDYFNYSVFFDQALQRIKAVRNPNSDIPEKMDLGWDIVSRNQLFNFVGNDFLKIKNVTEYAQKISLSCLGAIVQNLFREYNLDMTPVTVKVQEDRRSPIAFSFVDRTNKLLLLFKEIEECSFWKVKEQEPADVVAAMLEYKADNCAYIYIVKDYAYLQVLGHNDDEADPGRGYNIFSLKWIFDKYFDSDEYARFTEALDKYVNAVNTYIGYMYVKSLTPSAIVSFKKIVRKQIRDKDYRQLLSIEMHGFALDTEAYSSIRKQFIEQDKYRLLTGKDDFAESFITAEWLYDSMRKANAIDLTVVGMGYFKAIEQLLYNLICLHKNEKRMMRKDYSYKELPNYIELNDINIENEYLDATIGSMANFYKDNLDMLRRDLRFQTKKYIREAIFVYKDLRNGYFHKHNIHEWKKIDEIRDMTYYLLFLLLGSHQLMDSELPILGYLGDDYEDDFYRLCEYMNYHSGELFYFIFENGEEQIFIACSDQNTKIIDGHICYSGAYIKELGQNGQKYKVSREQLPLKICLGNLGIEQCENIKFNPHKVQEIYVEGKFVGPLIEDETI